MKRSEINILLAVAFYQAGHITIKECLRRLEIAEQIPDFRCQDIHNWKEPPAHSVCDCGNEMRNQFGPCAQCEEEHAAIYEPNGRRRVFIHE